MLDPTFGNGGMVATDFLAPLNALPAADVIQPDGRVVVAGTAKGDVYGHFALARYNADGSLDASFGTGGELISNLGNANEQASGVALQGDGKIIVAGATVSPGASALGTLVARYNQDGSLDTTFGSNGKTTAAEFATNGGVAGVVIQADGKIVVAGSADNASLTSDFGLIRFNADGSRDTSFGTVTTDFNGKDHTVQALIQQADGRIVLVGGDSANLKDVALARYNADGSLDTTFGSGGKVTTHVSADNNAYDIEVQSDGRLVVAAGAGYPNSFSLIRYNTDGSLDTSFGSGGVATCPLFTAAGAAAYSVLIQPDGKLVALGFKDFTDTRAAGMARFNPDGSLDTSFGNGGVLTVPRLIDGFSIKPKLVLQGTSIVALGVFSHGDPNRSTFLSRHDFELKRWSAQGVPDPAFGQGGTVTTTFLGSTNSLAADVAVESDGKLVVAGTVGLSFHQDFALARYLPNGTLDASFGNGGQVETDINDSNDVANAVAVQSDGKIVVAGISDSPTDPGSSVGYAVARYNPDGSLDTSFGTGGKVITNGSNDPNNVSVSGASSIVLQPDGRIIVAGRTAVIRYTASGALDGTFGTGGKVSADLGNVGGLVLQPDGKILVAGSHVTSFFQGESVFLQLARYNVNGTADSTFGTGGLVLSPFSVSIQGPLSVTDNNHALALQRDGRILAIGVSGNDLPGAETLARFDPNGNLDTSFGNAGLVKVNQAGYSARLVVQPDQRIVVGGTSFVGGTSGGFSLARFNPDGSPDTTFGTNGQATTSFGALTSVIQQPDGSLVAVGTTVNAQGITDFAAARFLPGPPLSGSTGDPNQRFLQQVYLDLLGRTIDPSGLSGWGSELAQGISREVVVRQIEASLEYRTNVVQGLYGYFLVRSADPGGLNGFVAALGQGSTVEQIEVIMLGSPEYFQVRAGSSNGFLQALYRDVLGRTVDPIGQSIFGGALNAGITSLVVASDVMYSLESDQDIVQADYHRFLRRAADPSGLALFTSSLMQGARDEDIIAAIVGSQEYFQSL